MWNLAVWKHMTIGAMGGGNLDGLWGLANELRKCVAGRRQSLWLWRSLSCSDGGGDIQKTLEFKALACRNFSF